MAEYKLVSERTFSGKGTLKLATTDKNFRHGVLYLSVLRPPRQIYANNAWNPSRSYYCNLVFRRNGYAMDEATQRYNQQSWDVIADITYQVLAAVKCSYKLIIGTVQNPVNVLAGGSPVISALDSMSALQLAWDEVLFQCYADTAIQARFYTVPIEGCEPNSKSQQPPPPPPPPRTPVPPGTPLTDLSTPYDGIDDGGNTQPYPGDKLTPPPPPDCTKMNVTVKYTLDGFGEQTRTIGVYAPVGDLKTGTYYTGATLNYSLTISCRGPSGGICGNIQDVGITASINKISNAFIVSATRA
jgi:hypothetical protein